MKNEAEEIGMNIFTSQLELSAKDKKHMLIMGDANLCSNKWNEENFLHKKLANQLIHQLDASGLKIVPVGPTFIADHVQNNGDIAESWIDHVYHSNELESQIQTEIINYGSSDHLPVSTTMKAPVSRTIHKKKIVKRKMKNFTNDKWNESSAKQDWSRIKSEPDLEKSGYLH